MTAREPIWRAIITRQSSSLGIKGAAADCGAGALIDKGHLLLGAQR